MANLNGGSLTNGWNSKIWFSGLWIKFGNLPPPVPKALIWWQQKLISQVFIKEQNAQSDAFWKHSINRFSSNHLEKVDCRSTLRVKLLRFYAAPLAVRERRFWYLPKIAHRSVWMNYRFWFFAPLQRLCAKRPLTNRLRRHRVADALIFCRSIRAARLPIGNIAKVCVC